MYPISQLLRKCQQLDYQVIHYRKQIIFITIQTSASILLSMKKMLKCFFPKAGSDAVRTHQSKTKEAFHHQ